MRSIIRASFVFVFGCGGAAPAPSTEPPVESAPHGFYCFDNVAIQDDSGCGRSPVECSMLASVRGEAYAGRVPFSPSRCEHFQAATCFSFRDSDVQWWHFRCFKTKSRCDDALQNLTEENVPLTMCQEERGSLSVPRNVFE